MDKENTPAALPPKPPDFTEVIDGMTYEVNVHFNQNSRESMTDKIRRLILNDCTTP